MKHLMIVASLAAAGTGCATKADKIAPTYVSPIQYQSLTCEQIAEEAARVAARASEAAGEQNKQAKGDAVATGVAVVVFWPALFFIGGKDQSAEVGRLKGEMQALEQASIAKNCGIQFQSAPPPKP